MTPNESTSGWEKRLSSEGKLYYINHNNRTTQWDLPQESLDISGLPLPNGWEVRATPDDRMYFLDHNTRTTIFQDPRTAGRADYADANQVIVQMDEQAKLGPLPRGFEICIGKGGAVYFTNHNTKTTTWEDPRVHIANL